MSNSQLKGHLDYSGGGRRLLPLFILLSPFLIYLNENGYALVSNSVWAIGIAVILAAIFFSTIGRLGGGVIENLITAGLIIFFIDIQSNLDNKWWWVVLIPCILGGTFLLSWKLGDGFYKIITAIFATFFIVTLVQLFPLDLGMKQREEPQVEPLESHYPPRVIHLIFDEHIGIEGIPTETMEGRALKKKLREFYARFNFRVFGAAYSHYSDTLDSLPSLLNYSNGESPDPLIRESQHRKKTVLLKNNYFSDLAEMGYRINVWESSWFDFCQGEKEVVGTCKTYPPWDTQVMEVFNYPLSSQVVVLLSNYMGRSYLYKKTRYAYKKMRKLYPDIVGKILPEWSLGPFPGMSSLNSLQVIDSVVKDTLSMPKGNVLFAHLIFPHFPFSVNSDCSVINDWGDWGRTRFDGFGTRRGPDPSSSRKETYHLYFEQIQCLYLKMEDLFQNMQRDGIFEDSLVIVHSDHGSRISLTSPFRKNKETITSQDLLDTYSTLFAVKFPREGGAYDPRVIPIEQLLKGIVSDNITLGRPLSVQTSRPFVYLSSENAGSGNSQRLQAIPYQTLHRQTR